MVAANLKFAFLLGDREVSSKEFEQAHFRQLLPTQVGNPTRSMMYQVWDAYCLYGADIDKDTKIKRVADEMIVRRTCCDSNDCMYCLELSQYKVQVFLAKVIKIDCIMFIFYNVARASK